MAGTWKNAGAGGQKAQAKDEYYGMKVRVEQGLYVIYVPPNWKCVARILMPNDNQFMVNGICISEICRILAVRWGIIKSTLGKPSSCYGCVTRQRDISAYDIYVPFNGGIKVADVFTVPDGRYVADATVLAGICRVLAKRYSMI